MMIHELRNSLENPANSLSDFDLYDGTSHLSDTGERITRDKALEYSPVWRAMDLVSGDAAKLGCFIYRRDGKGKERATEHPAYRLLRYNASPYMTADRAIRQLVVHAMGGNGYWLIERDGAGVPLELIPLNPDYVTPVRMNGVPYYIYQSPTVDATFESMDVIHLSGMGFDGLCGYSI